MTAPATVVTPTTPLRRLQVWRSPAGQPGWARPVLLVIAAVAAFSYAWGNTGVNLETFYAAAVRSMSQNWHNFFFASFDPWGTVSVDKLPGSFWVQALSLRVFGFHLWALVLPQVVEGTLTVLVLYRAVRRVAGSGAGLVAAAALALSPVTVLLNRGNVSDTLLILLLVLAADAALRATTSGRWQPLAQAGLWVGLAFQAKMAQAWLLLPVLALVYLLAAPTASLARRCGHVVVMGLCALVVSLSWMSAVALVPAHDRPYVDGSCDNSIYSQVFLYNGADRVSGHLLDQAGCRATSPPLAAATAHPGSAGLGSVRISGGLGKFLDGPFGRLDAWFFVPSVVALVALFRLRRKRSRTDPLRAATVLWVGWLAVTWVFFAKSSSLNSYYLAALVPPMAALCGMGFATAWQRRGQSGLAGALLTSTALVGALEGVALLPTTAGVKALVLASTGAAVVGLLVLGGLATRGPAAARWVLPSLFGVAVLTLSVGPAWASGTAVAADMGPFDAPYQAQALTTSLHAQAQSALDRAPAWNRLAASIPWDVSITTEESSAAVSTQTLLTGHEFLPVGGFTGRVPTPTLSQFRGDVAAGRVGLVIVAVRPETTNPDLRWALANCAPGSGADQPYTANGVHYLWLLCVPLDARR